MKNISKKYISRNGDEVSLMRGSRENLSRILGVI